MNERPIFVEVTYTVKNGKRDEFFQKVTESGIAEASRNEAGNMRYEFFYPLASENDIFLIEIWENTDAQKLHGTTDHYKKLTEIKQLMLKMSGLKSLIWTELIEK